MSEPAAIEDHVHAGEAGRRERVAALVLARLAAGPASEREVARDVAAFAEPAGTAALKAEVAAALAILGSRGHVAAVEARLAATPAGIAAVAATLGLAGAGAIGDWSVVRDRHLVAWALGISGAPAARRKAAQRLDGLRALVVEAAYAIAGGSRPSASRIRARLAVLALERAFGNSIKAGLGGKTAMSAKASRMLAGQLATTPRQHASDARLVAQLAQEAVGVARPDLALLRQGIVRRYLAAGTLRLAAAVPATRSTGHRAPGGRAQARRAAGETSPVRLVTPGSAGVAPPAAVAPSPPLLPRRPDPREFARAVAAAARERAEGWAGNRKAFVSQVWAIVRDRHADWGVSEIEFKSMLAEAHRLGLVVLANADLRDRRTLADIEASAVSYKNAVWHYVRVEE